MDRAAAPREGYLREGYHYFHLRDTAGQERDFHFHDFDKLVLLLAGRVTYLVEDRRYELRPWDILLVRHHTIHKALIDKSEPYDRIILYLDGGYIEQTAPGAELMRCFDRADESGRHRIAPDAPGRERLAALLRQLEDALSDDGFGAQALCDALLIQLLVLVGRAAPRDGRSTGPGSRRDEKISQVLTYINEHPDGDLTVERLSGQAFLSKYHFMRRFREQTGVTVHTYIMQRRLTAAARLIRSGVPAGKAAADCGFADYSTFYRAFRRTFGASPREVKQHATAPARLEGREAARIGRKW